MTLTVFQLHQRLSDELCATNLRRSVWVFRVLAALLAGHAIALALLHNEHWQAASLLGAAIVLAGLSVISPKLELRYRHWLGKAWEVCAAIAWLLCGALLAQAWSVLDPGHHLLLGTAVLVVFYGGLGLVLFLSPTMMVLSHALQVVLVSVLHKLLPLANSALWINVWLYGLCLLASLVVGVLQWQQKLQQLDLQTTLHKRDEELKTRQREQERLTRHDSLTGVYNRAALTDLFRQELARARRQMQHTALLLIDLDFFKRVNDTWGHPAGDAVLKHVASLLSRSVRSTDLVARLGGEEFVVLAPNTSEQSACVLAEKLRQRIQASPVVWNGSFIGVTLSMGIAECPPGAGFDFMHLYGAADAALYRAKEGGRNRWVVADQQSYQQAHDKT